LELKDIIKEITDQDKPLVNTHLAGLSQATAADVPSIRAAWRAMELKRRRQVITRLVDLARDSVELTFDPVYKIALLDPDAEVRTAAIDGLWENENPTLIKTYIRLMESDPSADVQAAAASALGKFAVLAECGQIRHDYGKTLGAALLAIINDGSRPVEIRRRALESVAPLSLPAAREAINKAYDSRDERFVISAIYAMGRTCDEAWLPILFKEMDNPNAEIRYEAAGALGEIGDESALARLIEHTRDPDIEVRLAVVQALAKIGGKDAKRALERIGRDPDEAVRQAIEEAISEIETMEDMTLMEMDVPGDTDVSHN